MEYVKVKGTLRPRCKKIVFERKSEKIKRKSLMRDSDWLLTTHFVFDFHDLRSNSNFMQQGLSPVA